MSAHPIPAISSEESSEESSHQLDLRLLKFRNRPEREDPSMLALALVGAGRAHDAIEVIDAALTADPDDADLLVSCGLAATRSGQLAFAQLVLTRAAKVAPDWAEPIRGLVAVLELRGQKDRALAVARHAIRVGASDAALAEMIRKDDRRRALDARIAALRADADAEDAALLGQELLAEDRAGDALEVATMHIGSGPIDADLAMVQARSRRLPTGPSPRRCSPSCGWTRVRSRPHAVWSRGRWSPRPSSPIWPRCTSGSRRRCARRASSARAPPTWRSIG
jgi:tetratricopeptide (TPR) repeat protein